MVEIDGSVVDMCREYLPSLSDGAFDDPRTELIIADGVNFVKETDRRFDVIHEEDREMFSDTLQEALDENGPEIRRRTLRDAGAHLRVRLHDAGLGRQQRTRPRDGYGDRRKAI